MQNIRAFLYGTVLILIIGLPLFGCTSSAPGCADAETIELVIQITKDEVAKAYGQEAADQFEYRVETIRTQSVNKDTGMCTCAADIVLIGPNGENTSPITYKSELVEGDDQFYVTVYGL